MTTQNLSDRVPSGGSGGGGGSSGGSNGTLGEIRQSILPEDAFQQLNGTSWILADGRDITGTDLGAMGIILPDLRGQFLRSAGGDSGEVGEIQGQGTAQNNLTLTWSGIITSGEESNTHTHLLFKSGDGDYDALNNTFASADSRNNGDNKDYQIGGHSSGVPNLGKSKDNAEKHTHNINVNQLNDNQRWSGDNETRPTNVAFYTYMKVNNADVVAPEPEPEPDPDPIGQDVVGSATFDDTSATEAYIYLSELQAAGAGNKALAFTMNDKPYATNSRDQLTSKFVFDKNYVDIDNNSDVYTTPSTVDRAYVLITSARYTLRLKIYPQELLLGNISTLACSWTFDDDGNAVSGRPILSDGTTEHQIGIHPLSAAAKDIVDDPNPEPVFAEYLEGDKWLPMRDLKSPDDDLLISELLEDLFETPIPLNNGIPDRTVFRVGNDESLPFID